REFLRKADSSPALSPNSGRSQQHPCRPNRKHGDADGTFFGGKLVHTVIACVTAVVLLPIATSSAGDLPIADIVDQVGRKEVLTAGGNCRKDPAYKNRLIIDLDDCVGIDKAMETIRYIRGPKVLSLNRTDVTTKGLQYLSNWTDLEEL